MAGRLPRARQLVCGWRRVEEHPGLLLIEELESRFHTRSGVFFVGNRLDYPPVPFRAVDQLTYRIARILHDEECE